MLTIKIAWRNILRHKGKSLIIGAILFLGAFIMTLGNGIISGMDKGLRENIVRSVTGDIVIISDKQETDNVFLNFMGKAIEPVNNYKEIKKVLGGMEPVERFLPAGKNMAMVLNEEGGDPGFMFVFGVDYEAYHRMFPGSIRAIEGAIIDTRTTGVLLPTGAREQLYMQTNNWYIPRDAAVVDSNLTDEAKEDSANLVIKDNMVFMGYNDDNTTNDIRLDVKGIIKYRALNKIWGHFIFMDIESYRRSMGYFAAAEKAAQISDANKQLLALEGDNLDELFTEHSFMVKDTTKVETVIQFTQDEKKEEAAAPADIEDGAYNMVYVLLKKGQNLKPVIQELNRVFKEKNLGARAVSWKAAIGTIGSMAVIIKGALFVFVLFLFFVAVIIIVNTLSMAAIERTPEIGMMRAIGARKSFIGMMFLGETASLSALFGGAGIVMGVIAVKAVSLMHITSDKDMVQLLFGGDTFNPLLSAPDILLTIIQLAFVTFLAVLYPLKVARGITPLDAVYRE